MVITDHTPDELARAYAHSSYPAAGISLQQALDDHAMRATLELRARMQARRRALTAALAGTTYINRSAQQ